MVNDNQYNMLLNSIIYTETEDPKNSFGEVDNRNDAGEKEEEEEYEKDVWHDGSELSIEDFKATGEDLDDYDDNFELDENGNYINNKDNNISKEEAALLDGGNESNDQKNEKLDNTDEDGVLLNEEDEADGSDLDVPGADLDDADEAIGEEDEENNEFTRNKQDD